MAKKVINGVEMISQQEIEDKFDISATSIREYEKRGLVKPTVLKDQGILKYKWYDEKAVLRIWMIRAYLEMGGGMNSSMLKQIFADNDAEGISGIKILRKALVEKREKISREIAFCELAEMYGSNIAAAMAFDQGSIDSFMGSLLDTWQRTGVAGRLKDMGEHEAASRLFDVDDIVLEIDGMRERSYADYEVQLKVTELVDRLSKLSLGEANFGSTSGFGFRLLCLLHALMITVGNGLMTLRWREKVGPLGVKYMIYALLYGMLQTLNDLAQPFQIEWKTLVTEEDKENYVLAMCERINRWLSSLSGGDSISEDGIEELKDTLRDLMEDPEVAKPSKKGCDELYEIIMDDLSKIV